ncbi:MAG: lipid III flippase WzxE [Arsenophonus sp.]
MSLAKSSIWTAISTLVKIGIGLIIIKLFAVSFGPSGAGQAGNFRQLITIIGILSGAGIFNGVTKYIAEYHKIPTKLNLILGTSSLIILGSSILLAIIFLFFSSFISLALFNDIQYQIVIFTLAIIQIGIAYSNYFLSILKAYRDEKGNALSIISGSLVGMIVYYFCFRLGDYQGALIGLALFPALTVVPAAIMLLRHKQLSFSYFKPRWNSDIGHDFAKFTLMALITSVTLPFAYIIIRNLLVEKYSWDEVGIWQAVISVSDAYLQFITTSFTVYLLPTLTRLQNGYKISIEIFKALKFVLPTVAIGSFTIWLLRDLVILLLFSDKFMKMRDLFAWQLTGDIFKVGAYVFGYLVIAKAEIRFYFLTEVTQFILLIVFSYWLIPNYGALGAVQAYMATYIIYFMICSTIFYFYQR